MRREETYYKKNLKKLLGDLRPIFASAAIGDFSNVVKFSKRDDDEFLEIYAGIEVMVEVIQEKIGELKRINARLHSRLGKVSKEKKRVSIEIEKKDDFVSILAHELRNPIMPLLHSLELIKMSNIKNPDIKENLKVALHQVNKLSIILKNLLDVSLVLHNQMKLKIKVISASDILNSAIESTRTLIKEADQKLIIKIPRRKVYIKADFIYFEQVLVNLISNAIKYSEPRKTITITLRRKKNKAVFSIKDYGIGIVRKDISQLFQIFFRAENSRSRTRGGLGIGLKLSKDLVELHGGTLTARSKGINKGSEFIVQVPLVKAPKEKLKGEKEIFKPTSLKKGIRVLIIDDNRESADMMRKLILLLGEECKVVYNGKSAIALAPSFKPDIAFIDIGMPKMNGYEVVKALKKKIHNKIKFIALTGYGRKEDFNYSKKMGFDQHVVKPIAFSDLQKIVRE